MEDTGITYKTCDDECLGESQMEKVAPQLVAVPAPTQGCLDLRCQEIKDGLDPVPAAHRRRAQSLSKASVSHCQKKNIQYAEYAKYTQYEEYDEYVQYNEYDKYGKYQE